MRSWPKKINIMGIEHAVTYCNDIADVDINRDRGLWGQIDFRRRTIRILRKDDRDGNQDGERSPADILQTLLHETMHGIIEYNPLIKTKIPTKNTEDVCEAIALNLADTLIRNKLVDLPPKKQI